MIKQYGGIPQILGVARDYETSIIGKNPPAMSADAIITSGGISRGDYDLVKKVLQKIGDVKLSGIRIEPGSSFSFSIITSLTKNRSVPEATPVFSLSGSPAGCMTNFVTLVKPAILKMLGLNPLSRTVIEAVVEDDGAGEKDAGSVIWTVLRKTGNEYRVSLHEPESTSPFLSIANANSLTLIPERTKVRKGDRVNVYPLEWNPEYKQSL
jgi:molybdopterin molybdotransferase